MRKVVVVGWLWLWLVGLALVLLIAPWFGVFGDGVGCVLLLSGGQSHT